MSVFELPPNESFIRCVNLLSLYGIYALFELFDYSDSAYITLPNAVRL
jgi:hypothetical protein